MNILVSSSYRAIISDFGSARILEEIEGNTIDQDYIPDVSGVSATDESAARPQVTIAVNGNQLTLTGPAWSLRWVAPEVIMEERLGLASDIWAVGWVCWEVFCRLAGLRVYSRDRSPLLTPRVLDYDQ